MDWKPRTKLGEEVLAGKISMDEIFATGKRIKEPEIIDYLIPNLQNDVIFIGGSPGKGGGIRRTPTRRTARMHRSGRRYRISALAVVGNGDGYVGLGKAVGLEHGEAIEKAIENAKLNIIPVKRGCGSWECACGQTHSIPVSVTGKTGSVRVDLWPAPKGIGLAAPDEAKKIFQLAGVKDIWSKRDGESKTRINYAYAIFDALKKINSMKLEFEKEKKPKEISEAALEEEIEKEIELEEAEDLMDEELEKTLEEIPEEETAADVGKSSKAVPKKKDRSMKRKKP